MWLPRPGEITDDKCFGIYGRAKLNEAVRLGQTVVRQLILLFLSSLSLLALAQTESGKPRILRVVMDNNYPPFVFCTNEGKLQGIVIDQWRAWEKKTGIRVEIHAMDWGKALESMQAGKFDVIDTIFDTPERRDYFAFTPAYASIEVPIFFRKDISGITDLASLRGFPVAAKAGDYAADMLKAEGVTTVLLYKNYESIIAAAQQHKINVFVIDAPPALYFLNKLGLESEFRRSPPVNIGEFHRAVRKDDDALRQVVTAGFAAIDPKELQQIDEKWFGRPLEHGRYLAYAGYVAAAALLLIAGLLAWNRMLHNLVAHRTAALQESEQRFRQLAENIREVFWLTEPTQQTLLYVSPAYEDIWGRTCASLYASPLLWLEAIHPEDRERVRQATATRQVAGTYDEEYRIVRPDGSIAWIHDQAFPVRDAAGAVYRIAGVAEDITGRKQLEEQFLRGQRMEAIGTLASGLAHDLNNILAPILIAAGLLKEKLSEPRDRAMMEIIRSGAEHGAAVIRQLLLFSRGIEGARSTVQLRHLVGEMAHIARETFPRHIRVVSNGPAPLWPIQGNPTQIHQVLLNLCVNARDAMPEGGELAITADNLQATAAYARLHPPVKPGRYVLLTVADTGKGIPQEIIHRIYDPFFTTKEVGHGTGLGLSTVLGIVKSHGGFVTVDSEPGRGTTFRVYWPAEDATAAAAAEPLAESPAGHGELILFVDDEEDIREAARCVLEENRYRVITAANGQEGLAAFREHRGALRAVVTDLTMPAMDGPQLIRALRELEPKIGVIATSGLDAQGRREELAALGVREILVKPYDHAHLLQAVHRALQEL